jgi:hypothetical protein
VYVAIGTAYIQGFDFPRAWRRVHAANMTKVRAPAAKESKRRSSYDVIKPSRWVPPFLGDIVASKCWACGEQTAYAGATGSEATCVECKAITSYDGRFSEEDEGTDDHS